MLKNINWDYVVGLVMGVVVCKSVERTYKLGYQKGVEHCGTILKEAIDDMKSEMDYVKEEE